MTGVKYGLFLAAIWMPLWFLSEGGHMLPLVLFFILETIHLAVYSAVVWRRTRLPILASGGVFGSAAFVLWAWMLVNGVEFPDRNWQTYVLSTLVVAGPFTLLVSSIVHREEWALMREHFEKMSLRDVLLMRHIPNLASGR